MSIKTFSLTFIALAMGAVAAQAQTTVLDNYSTSSGNSMKGSSNNTSVSQAFVTGGSATTLVDVIFPQLLQGPSPSTYYYGNNGGTETFALFSNNPATGLPLNSLVTLTLSFGAGSSVTPSSGALPAGYGQTIGSVPTDALSQAAATLAPGTKYWLVLTSAGAISWDYTLSTTAISNGGFSLPATGPAAVVGTTSYTLAQGPQQIYLSVVPEPSTYCLMAVAGLALVVSRKRKLA